MMRVTAFRLVGALFALVLMVSACGVATASSAWASAAGTLGAAQRAVSRLAA